MKRTIYKILLVNHSNDSDLLLAEAYSKGLAYIIADKMRVVYNDFDATIDVTRGNKIEYSLMTGKAIEVNSNLQEVCEGINPAGVF